MGILQGWTSFFMDIKNRDIHFETVDFKGNRIVCSESCWQGHIVRNRRHLDEGQEELIISTLQKPYSSIRYQDVDYPNRMIYYGFGSNTKYIKVTVEFQDSNCTGIGIIITAYPLNNMKPNEKPELPC